MFDIDPLSNSTVLLAAQSPDAEGWKWHAVRFNWRTGEVYETVPIPNNTHDVDYLGDHRYAVAEKGYSAKSHKDIYQQWEAFNRQRGWVNESRGTTFPRAYVVDASSGEITWQYRFADHYRRGGNGSTKFRDWTHLNDVDVVDNGSSVLLSPRNFDRVVLVNKSTKETEWTLGEEDNYDYLYAQHNPQLIDTDPATVLVADCHNDRVVEYVRDDGEWVQTWSYEGNLKWPRDADRLPNGNTLVVDSNGDRVLEVTPDKEVVWEMNVRERRLGRKPYDVERVRLGDEPGGRRCTRCSRRRSSHPRRGTRRSPPTRTRRGTPPAGRPTRLRTRRATGDGVASDDLGTLAATVQPLRHAYVEYFTLAAWVLPLWMGMLEFTLFNLAAVALVGWVGAEGLLWWWRRG